MIGVLFIRFDAMVGFTSAIGLGDTSGLEVSVSHRVLDWVGRVPGWVFPATVALGAGDAQLRSSPERVPTDSAAGVTGQNRSTSRRANSAQPSRATATACKTG